jgi:hypothetical protein
MIAASDHELYCVCKTHAVTVWTTEVAHWNGNSDLRSTTGPVEVRASIPEVAAFAWAS